MTMKIGDVFGRWTVEALVPHRKNPQARCRCVCGSIGLVQRGALVFGKSQSCGCLKFERLHCATTTHGMASTRAYALWLGMRDRCNNPNTPAYANYGGRGVRVLWATFEEFHADMGDPPAGLTIERLDANGHYSKANCVWADWSTQAANKRTSRRWVIHGVTYDTSPAAARALGTDAATINRRANGYWRRGKYHPPVAGYSSHPLYVTSQISTGSIV